MESSRKDIKEIVGNNIAYLRKESKWTQAELAERLNYSDKAISKWERGESAPDYDCLLELSKIFNVQVDYFFHEDSSEKSAYINSGNYLKIRELLTVILLCATAYVVATAIFLIAWFDNPESVKYFWISFVWATPVCSLLLLRYFKRNRHTVGRIYCSSIFLWTLLASIHLQCLLVNINAWMIYLIGVPLEAVIIIYNFVKK